MKIFYPLRDPITDLHRVLVEGKHIDLTIDVNGVFAGTLRTTIEGQLQLVNLLLGRKPVAEQDDAGHVDWLFDYDKRVVVSDEGAIVQTRDLQ
jgi:hypothetical protein